MMTTTTTHTRRAMLGAIGIGTAAIAIGAPAATTTSATGVSPTFRHLLDSERSADKASADYERNVYDPLFQQFATVSPPPAAFDAAYEEAERLTATAVAAMDAVVAYPVTSIADLHAKMERIMLLGYMECDTSPVALQADIARLAAREA